MRLVTRISVVLLISLTVKCGFSFAVRPQRIYDLNNIKEYYNNFLIKHNKTYSPHEYEQRLANFRITLMRVNEVNSVPSNIPVVLNKYADFTDDERDEILRKKEIETNRNTDNNENDPYDLDSNMNFVPISV